MSAFSSPLGRAGNKGAQPRPRDQEALTQSLARWTHSFPEGSLSTW